MCVNIVIYLFTTTLIQFVAETSESVTSSDRSGLSPLNPRDQQIQQKLKNAGIEGKLNDVQKKMVRATEAISKEGQGVKNKSTNGTADGQSTKEKRNEKAHDEKDEDEEDEDDEDDEDDEKED